MDTSGLILLIIGAIFSLGQGFILFVFNGLKKDNRDTNSKIDKHIANYEIHKIGG